MPPHTWLKSYGLGNITKEDKAHEKLQAKLHAEEVKALAVASNAEREWKNMSAKDKLIYYGKSAKQWGERLGRGELNPEVYARGQHNRNQLDAAALQQRSDSADSAADAAVAASIEADTIARENYEYIKGENPDVFQQQLHPVGNKVQGSWRGVGRGRGTRSSNKYKRKNNKSKAIKRKSKAKTFKRKSKAKTFKRNKK